MNRRTFISSAAAAMAVAPFLRHATAQSAPEARWDETSFLFGNAFDVLPKAKDGEIELLNLSISPDGPSLGFTALNGLVHNATDDAYMFYRLEAEDSALLSMVGTAQNTIAPGAYALVTVSLVAELEPDAELPKLTPVFTKRDEMGNDAAYLTEAVPLEVSDVTITSEMLTATITNTSETDLPDGFLSGMLMFFDDDGMAVNGIALGELTALAAGASHDAENYLFSDFDPALRYLMGYYGTP